MGRELSNDLCQKFVYFCVSEAKQYVSIWVTIGVGGGGGGGGRAGALCPPKNGNQKIGQNAGRIRGKFGQKVEGKIKKGQQKIKANSLEDNGKVIVFLSQ